MQEGARDLRSIEENNDACPSAGQLLAPDYPNHVNVRCARVQLCGSIFWIGPAEGTDGAGEGKQAHVATDAGIQR